MNLHEYQAKQLLADYGVRIPAGFALRSAHDTALTAERLGGNQWVIKAQIHAGARGKAGGVRRVDTLTALQAAAEEMLGRRMVTAQTGPQGLPVEAVLIEAPCAVAREFYVAMSVDHARGQLCLSASQAGGMGIEDATAAGAAIQRLWIDPTIGVLPYTGRRLAFALGLEATHISACVALAAALYHAFIERDATLIEINPLALTMQGQLLALDAKISIDDNALYRQPSLVALRDESQEEPAEIQARRHDLNYVVLAGDIACMVNGAGLAMATMDLIKLHGGEPANFLDVGGTATAERVTEAFKLILTDSRVRAVLVNIFGGIVRCDLIAQGIIQAVRDIQVHVPVVVRLEGTRAEEGRNLLRASGLKIITATGLEDAARKVVASTA